MHEQAPILIQYESVIRGKRYARLSERFRKSAKFFALAPMSVGVGILILYAISGWGFLAQLGLYMLPLGGLMVLASLILTILWGTQLRLWCKHEGTAMEWRPVVMMLLLLLSNFLVAAGCTVIGAILVIHRTGGSD